MALTRETFQFNSFTHAIRPAFAGYHGSRSHLTAESIIILQETYQPYNYVKQISDFNINRKLTGWKDYEYKSADTSTMHLHMQQRQHSHNNAYVTSWLRSISTQLTAMKWRALNRIVSHAKWRNLAGAAWTTSFDSTAICKWLSEMVCWRYYWRNDGAENHRMCKPFTSGISNRGPADRMRPAMLIETTGKNGLKIAIYKQKL
jgi:hypothetical protein